MSETVKQRLAALRERMIRQGVGLVAIAPGSHMDWLLGFHPHPDERPCLLLVSHDQEAFLMPTLNAKGTREFTDIAFFEWADETGPQEALREALSTLRANAPGRVVLDETMRADFALLLLDALPEGTHREFSPATLGALRMHKDEAEYQLLKMNAAICDRAMQKAFSVIRPGMTENQVAAEIRAHFASEGADTMFWIVGSGLNGAYPHHSASDRVIGKGDSIVIDIGGQKKLYQSDMTRMAIVGEGPTGYAEIHAIVERAVQAALAAARPGVLARNVDASARKVITDAGYGEFFTHRLGHGLGIDGHEPPYVTSTTDVVLEAGMVFSIEPGIYLPGRFGVRLEEIVILREDGPEILSDLPREVHKVAAS